MKTLLLTMSLFISMFAVKAQSGAKELENVSGSDGLYSFSVPINQFTKNGDTYRSSGLNAAISVRNHNYHVDQEIGLYFRMKELFEMYKSEYNMTSGEMEVNHFFMYGKTADGNLIYVRGLYDELESMQGRDEGDARFVWSKAGVLIIEFPQSKKAEFDKLIPVVADSFKVDFTL